MLTGQNIDQKGVNLSHIPSCCVFWEYHQSKVGVAMQSAIQCDWDFGGYSSVMCQQSLPQVNLPQLVASRVYLLNNTVEPVQEWNGLKILGSLSLGNPFRTTSFWLPIDFAHGGDMVYSGYLAECEPKHWIVWLSGKNFSQYDLVCWFKRIDMHFIVCSL